MSQKKKSIKNKTEKQVPNSKDILIWELSAEYISLPRSLTCYICNFSIILYFLHLFYAD